MQSVDLHLRLGRGFFGRRNATNPSDCEISQPRTIHQIVQGYRLRKYYRGYQNYWTEIVTGYLFQVLVFPISIDVHKGGIKDYITIARPDSLQRKNNKLFF